MAFKPRNLSQFHSVPTGVALQGIHAFMYATADSVAEVLAGGYFNDARKTVKVNDIVFAICVTGGAAEPVAFKFTAVPSSGSVTVAKLDWQGGTGVTGDQAAIAALTDNSAGSANDTIEPLADGTTYATDVGAIRNNFADLAAKVNEIRTALINAGLLAAT